MGRQFTHIQVCTGKKEKINNNILIAHHKNNPIKFLSFQLVTIIRIPIYKGLIFPTITARIRYQRWINDDYVKFEFKI